MKRINGFLDFDDYYKNNDNLYEKGYIKKSDYAPFQYWLTTFDHEKYYFKKTSNCYREVIACEIAKLLSIPYIEYDLAIFKRREGVISKNYHKDNALYIPGYTILNEYDENYHKVIKDMGMLSDYDDGDIKKNNLEIIWQALEFAYKDNKNVSISKLMYDIVLQYIFSILTNDPDLMAQNWEIEETKDSVSIVPMFDKEYIFSNFSDIYSRKNGVALSVDFSDTRSKTQESLERFINVSSKEYIDLFISKYKLFDRDALEDIIDIIESRYNIAIPRSEKNEIRDNFMINYEKITEVLNKYNLLDRGR